MIHEVRTRSIGCDTRGDTLLHEIRTALGITSITCIKAVKVYRLEGIDAKEAAILTKEVLFEAINQEHVINAPLVKGATTTIEVGVKPGVMNPEVASLQKAAHDLKISTLTAADTSWEYHFYGTMTEQELEQILNRFLVNKTVERVITYKPATLCITGFVGSVTTVPLRTMFDQELMRCAKEQQLFLNLAEMQEIQKHFCVLGRDPYDAELETIAQTWSEHCSHKTFKSPLLVNGEKKEPLFARLKKVAEQYAHNVVSAFVDNAGVFCFYEGYAVLGKVETHNSPSAIEPYGGAATGSGGVFRDVMGTGQGAKVIASTDMFCFAPPTLSYEQLPSGCLHPKYLLRKVVAGVRDYGNRMGIPTNNGSVHFHEDFKAKPTVIVGAYGIAPEQYCKKGVAQTGDRIFVVGGRTGRDGIHGATFSSGEMTANTISVNATAVQIGNAIEQKRMADALLVCRDAGLIRAITDCGAGGLSSAIGEMGADLGVQVNLEKVLLKYTGLAPWEIWVSESQERMVCAIAQEHVQQFKDICALYSTEVTDIGYFTGTKKLVVMYDTHKVCNLDMYFLHEGRPNITLYAEKQAHTHVTSINIPVPDDWEQLYCNVMSHWNICSKEPIVRQYDHGVQGTNALPPFTGQTQQGPTDAAVLTPLLDKPYGLIIGHGMNPILNRIDPYAGSVWAIVEALSNVVAVGGNPQDAALIDNFIWPYPDKESLYDLDQSMQACIDAMHAFKIPFISGKDSLSSTYRYADGSVLKIPPVLCISAMSKILDVTKTISSDFKKPNSVILFIGDIDTHAMGGSVYADVIGCNGGNVPTIDLVKTGKRFIALHQLIQAGLIRACHDISEGGIAVAVAEMCFGNTIGAVIELGIFGDQRPELLLFNETAGCFIIEVDQGMLGHPLFKELDYVVVGHTIADPKIIVYSPLAPKEQGTSFINGNTILFLTAIEKLRSAWQRPLKEIFNS